MKLEKLGEVAKFEQLDVCAAFMCFVFDQHCISIKVTDGKEGLHAVHIPFEEGEIQRPIVYSWNTGTHNPVLHLKSAKINLLRLAPAKQQSMMWSHVVPGNIYQDSKGVYLGVETNSRQAILIDLETGLTAQKHDHMLVYTAWNITLNEQDDSLLAWPMASKAENCPANPSL